MTSVSVVVPTFNEAGNVAELVRRLESVAVESSIEELIFVDDSTDHTPAVIREVARNSGMAVRLIHRADGERVGGLSGAVLEGISAARAPWVLVMDGDLQHPPEEVPRMMAVARGDGDHDIVAASRYREGGAADGLSGVTRRLISAGSVRVARILFPRRLAGCTDTMTGFFAVRRSAVELSTLRPRGFKVLLEILGRNQLRVAEVPLEFARRHSGSSKASVKQGLRFLAQLASLRIDAWLPAGARRGLSFAAIGFLGLLVDVAVFNLLLASTGRPLTAKLVSSGMAILASYVLNRHWTWRDRPKVRGLRTLLTFAALSLIGVAISEACLLISHYGLDLRSVVADNVSANVAGLGLGMIWRFWSYNKWAFPVSGALPSIPVPMTVRVPSPLEASIAASVGAHAE